MRVFALLLAVKQRFSHDFAPYPMRAARVSIPHDARLKTFELIKWPRAEMLQIAYSITSFC
jgi:hypothetical protein